MSFLQMSQRWNFWQARVNVRSEERHGKDFFRRGEPERISFVEKRGPAFFRGAEPIWIEGMVLGTPCDSACTRQSIFLRNFTIHRIGLSKMTKPAVPSCRVHGRVLGKRFCRGLCSIEGSLEALEVGRDLPDQRMCARRISGQI